MMFVSDSYEARVEGRKVTAVFWSILVLAVLNFCGFYLVYTRTWSDAYQGLKSSAAICGVCTLTLWLLALWGVLRDVRKSVLAIAFMQFFLWGVVISSPLKDDDSFLALMLVAPVITAVIVFAVFPRKIWRFEALRADVAEDLETLLHDNAGKTRKRMVALSLVVFLATSCAVFGGFCFSSEHAPDRFFGGVFVYIGITSLVGSVVASSRSTYVFMLAAGKSVLALVSMVWAALVYEMSWSAVLVSSTLLFVFSLAVTIYALGVESPDSSDKETGRSPRRTRPVAKKNSNSKLWN